MKRNEMVEDGQVKGLLVHPDWWEPYHPLLVPPPLRADGLPRRRPAPDGVPAPTAPAMVGSLVSSDTQFANVVLLLHMDNTGVPGTFVDSSNFNQPVTDFIGLQEGSTVKFGAGAGAFPSIDLNSPDKLSVPVALNGSMDLHASSTWTIEEQGYVSALGGNDTTGHSYIRQYLWDNTGSHQNTSNPNSIGSACYIDSAGNLNGFIQNNPDGGFNQSWSHQTVLVPGQFYHVAMVKNGSSFDLYLNGIKNTVGVTYATAFAANDGTGLFFVGNAGQYHSIRGFYDEVRVTKGVARYTANFTPPTQAFADANGPFSQINLTWTAGSSSGSQIDYYYLYRSDNGSQYALLATIPVVVTQTVTNDGFTQTSTYAQPYVDNTLVAGHVYNWVVLSHAVEGGFSVASNVVSTAFPAAPVLSVAAPAKLSWTEASAGIQTYQIYRNLNGGAYALLTTVAGTITKYTDGTVSTGLYDYYVVAIGSNGLTSANSNVVAVDNTFGLVTYLLHMDGTNGGTTFVDNSPYAHAMTGAFGAITDTSLFKFAPSSLKSLGLGGIFGISGAEMTIGTGNFTLEGFFNLDVTGVGVGGAFFRQRLVSSGDLATFALTAGNKVTVSGSDGSNSYGITGSTNITSGTWIYIALVRSGNTFYIFLNGILEGTTVTGPTLNFGAASSKTTFGYDEFAGNVFQGHMDEWRFTAGVARYTSNFTPPSAPFPNS